MPKCYVMVEDLEGSVPGEVEFQYALDMGLNGAPPPETVEDMTPAQELVWNLFNVIRSMVEADHKAIMEAETKSRIVVPAHLKH